jgi:uncharacterized protein
MARRRWLSVLQFPLTRIVVASVPLVGVQIVADGVYRAFGRSLGPGMGVALDPLGALLVLAACATALPLYVGFVRLVERRPVVELGTERIAGELGVGFALGLGLFATTIAILVVAGFGRIDPGDGTALLPSLFVAIGAGLGEELLFRGVWLRILEERLGSWIALAVTAAMFGCFHLGNAGATAGSTVATALEAGVLLGAAYLCTRRLWLPIAMHIGWNLCQGGILGVPTAARPVPHAVWSTQLSGPALVTGGDYGADRSVVAVAICLAIAVTLLVIAHRRGTIVRPAWTRPA